MQTDWKQDFGPYSKKYMSLSHIPVSSYQAGARFDITVHPMLANGANPVPNVTFPSGWRPGPAAVDLSDFSAEFTLDAGNQVRAKVTYFALTEHSWGICTTFHNPSPYNRNALINYYAGITYPFPQMLIIKTPPSACLVQAEAYQSLLFAKPRPWDHLTPDGLRQGEVIRPDFCGGKGLGAGNLHPQRPDILTSGPGRDPGDRLVYQFQVADPIPEAVLLVRYRSCGTSPVSFATDGGVLTFPPAGDFRWQSFPLGRVATGTFELTMVALGAEAGLELDCFVLLPEKDCESVEVIQEDMPFEPMAHFETNHLDLVYTGIATPYRLEVFHDRVRCRKIASGCLEDAVPSRLSNPDPTFDDVLAPFTTAFQRKCSDKGYYDNLIAANLYIPAQSFLRVFAVLTAGTKEAFTPAQVEARYELLSGRPHSQLVHPDGQAYLPGVNQLRNTLLMNVVYPQMLLDKPIVHFTPGKRWDSFYTWDSGFIGLGMLQISPDLARYILASYLVDSANPHFAFLHHGAIVPVQFYLFNELLQTCSDPEECARAFYPGLQRYLAYLTGAEGSTMARFQATGLLTNYDYFYNSGGMDDYPAQLFVHQNRITPFCAPAMFTAHVARAAAIMERAAQLLGYAEDATAYRALQDRLGKALQFAWDEEAGYFGYTLYNMQGQLQGLVRSPQGENMNKGMDGVMALVSGRTSPDQNRRLLDHLFSPQEMWTPLGITAVDQSASYYRDNGYWNGTVWFSHQWFIWKALLDLNQGDLAWQLAQTALETWKTEFEVSGNTFEEMHLATGRGGWFHHFGGLSAPILIWCAAYFQPGQVSVGFDSFIQHKEFSADYSRAELLVDTQQAQGNTSLLAVMGETEKQVFSVTVNGAEVPFKKRTSGALEMTLPPQGRWEIQIQSC